MSQPTSDGSTGATPGAGATPTQPAATTQTPQPASATPAASTTQPTQPATGEESLGESGKKILAEARRLAKEAEDRAKAAETERDQLKASTQSDAEKALEAARKEAATGVKTEYEGRIRRAEVRRALTAAGIAESELDLASSAPEFAKLKVTDSGDVEGIGDVVKAFQTAHPNLFAKPGNTTPDYGGGVRNGGAGLTLEQIKAMTPEEVANRWPEVEKAMAAAGRR